MAQPAKKLEPAKHWLVERDNGVAHPIHDGFLISRTAGDLVVPDPLVSSKHCVFHVRGNSLEIEDLGSRNGTFVGGKRLEPKARLALLPKSSIRVGNVVLDVRGEEATAVPAAKQASALKAAPAPTPTPASVSKPASLPPPDSGKMLELDSNLAPLEMNSPDPVPEEKPAAPAKLHLVAAAKPAAAASPKPVTLSPPKLSPPTILPSKAPALAPSFNGEYALYGFMALNVLAFALAQAVGVSPLEPSVADLIKIGGNVNGLTTGGQWWRLLTATFAHAGVLHLTSNMLALFFMGRHVARCMSAATFSLIYLAAGIAGSVASIALNPPSVVSVGASGSVFGVVGALLALQFMKVLDARVVGRAGALTTVNFILRNLGIGAAGVDIFAHLGGVGAGFGLCWILFARRENQEREGLAKIAGGALALIALLAVMVPHHKPPNLASAEFLKRIGHAGAAFGPVQKTYKSIMDQRQQGQLTTADLGNALVSQVVPMVDKIIAEVSAAKPTNERQENVVKTYGIFLQKFREINLDLQALSQANDPAVAARIAEEKKALQEATQAYGEATQALVQDPN